LTQDIVQKSAGFSDIKIVRHAERITENQLAGIWLDGVRQLELQDSNLYV